MEKWKGKNAVVTGASAGIGEEIVRDFAKEGINVVALARRVEKLESLKEELKNAPGKVIAVACDVSDKESVVSAFKSIEEIFGTIHILVNNAGVIRDVMVFDNDDDMEAIDKIEEVIQTNLTGLVHCSRKAFRLMEKSDDYGIIINIGSITGFYIPNAGVNYNVYPGTKHAVRATTEVMRQELVKKNNKKIRVAEISPGLVVSELREAAGLPKHKIPEFLRAADVSQAVTFLLMTPHSVNITEIIIKPTGEKF